MFASVSEIMPKAISATTIGFTNMIVMLSGVILQPAFGYLLNLHRDGTIQSSGNSVYSIDDYNFALVSVPLSLVLAALVVRSIKDTYPYDKNGELSQEKACDTP
jgi:hypothetical protein